MKPSDTERICVYKVTCLVTGKAYIGITTRTAEERWQQHRFDAQNNRRCKGALHCAIKKYGVEQFDTSVLYEAVSQDEGRVVERGLIAAHGTMRPHGYNLTSGGEMRKGFRHSPETVERNRARNLGKAIPIAVRQKISAALKGKPKSASHIERLIVSSTGRKHTAETRQKLSIIGTAKRSDPDIAAMYTAATKASGPKISAAKKIVWANPEFRARMIVARNASPKVAAYRAMQASNRRVGPKHADMVKVQ